MKVLCLLVFASLISSSNNWGFFAHKQINYYATFTLPPEMIGFYKANISFIKEEAVAPDRRRYSIEEEAARHYIDLDIYPTPPPKFWDDAITKLTEDTLQKYGVLPWNLIRLKYRLTQAFRDKNTEQILRLSADIGHYIADAHVPLHTTKNYNGQMTGQEGIHGFWESRLPELFFKDYQLLTGKAVYYNNISDFIWTTINNSHAAVDSVLHTEKELGLNYPSSKKYSYEDRGSRTIKVYSRNYSKRYHTALRGMVERQVRKSILAVGSFWYTCWVDAGQPELGKTSFKWKPQEAENFDFKSCH